MRFLRETLPALLLSFASVCRAQTLPTISPATQATVTIENPRSPHAKSYLDLDSAKTFQREDAPEEFVRSRRWITESGIDLMCETEPPAEGFVAYDLTIVEDPDVFDAITDYADTRKRLSGLEPKTFDFVSVLSQPKTLIFRTREDAIGALEVATASDPSALSVR